MEQKIKNFDRGIEQMMNEHEVAPPFGMWNRISAELEAMPVAATAPVATSLIPKRAMVGFIAAALILGTTVLTGYLVNSSVNNKTTNSNAPAGNNTIGVSTKPTVTNTPTATTQTIAVKNETTAISPIVMKAKVRHNVASNPVQSTIQAAQQVTPVINEPVAPATTGVIINNATTDVPTPIEPIAQGVTENQTYFFPPIDVTTPEKTKAANESPIVAKKNSKNTTTASSDNDGPSDHKIKFRMHNKKRGWAYGSIIR